MAEPCTKCDSKYSKMRKSFKKHLEEYLLNSSIHGLRYFAQHRSFSEKFWWILVFITCLGILCNYTIRTYQKWDETPVIVTFATKPTPIYEIPFPAVTICLESKIDPNKFNLTRFNQKIIDNQTLKIKEEAYLNYVKSMCYVSDSDRNYSQLDDNEKIFEIMEDVMPKVEFFACGVWGLVVSCEEILVPIITDEGPCRTFNLQDRDEIFKNSVLHYSNYHKVNESSKWNMESGYSLYEDENIEGYPRRALLSGARYSTEFDMRILKNSTESDCRNSIEGFRVHLHAPMVIPNPGEDYFRLQFDHATVAAITPSLITTSRRVRKYSPEKRSCYFQNEQKLEYFKLYSRHSCNLECLTNTTLAMCDCVQFYMPSRWRLQGSGRTWSGLVFLTRRLNSTRICGADDYNCVFHAEYFYQSSNLERTLGKMTSVQSCNCLPLCTDVSYEVSISETKWHWAKSPKHRNVSNLMKEYHFSRLSLYFPRGFFIGAERNELYGATDFLANFGGLLSLFTGFSVLSLMEIIYFFTVRLMFNSKWVCCPLKNENQVM